MTDKLKTLAEIEVEFANVIYNNGPIPKLTFRDTLRQAARQLFENLTFKDSIYPVILDKFPENLKGECAKDLWNDTKFRYGAEYGMLAVIRFFCNLDADGEEGKKE